jgi:GGDEF domain-containing protein
LSLADSEIGDPAARPTLSIGITFRRPGSGEDAGTLLRRALLAAREVRNAGGGAWRVAHGAVPRR